jgi:hypothetical protein
MRFAILALALLAIGAPVPVAAQSGEVSRRVPDVVRPEPFGDVRIRTGSVRVQFPVDPATLEGSLSAGLSTACTQLRFNQSRRGKYFVLVPIPNERPRRFGFARSDGFNLRDPDTLRAPEQLYLFERDGTSECRVYVYAGGPR